MKPKIIRASTAAIALDVLLRGQLAFLNENFDVVAVSRQDEHLEKVREREGVRVVSVPMKRNISPFRDLMSLIRLYRLFMKEAPFIVHSITPKAGLLCMAAAYFARVPVRIHTFTGLVFPGSTGFKHFLLLNMDRLMCLFATHIYPEGEGVRNDLIKFRVTKKQLKVLANGNVNGIDIDYFDPKKFSCEIIKKHRQLYGIEENDFVFIFIGRLVSDKGVNELVTAFESLNVKYKNVKLLLVGPLEPELDPLHRKTLDFIENLDSIITTGYQSEISHYYAMSDALVLPSYREGFPNVVIQAGAMGLPCIVTDINGSNEIIIEGVNGVIIPKKNVEFLFSAMEEFVIQRNGNLIKLSENARSLIVKRYEQRKVWKAILEEYNQIIGSYKSTKE